MKENRKRGQLVTSCTCRYESDAGLLVTFSARRERKTSAYAFKINFFDHAWELLKEFNSRIYRTHYWTIRDNADKTWGRVVIFFFLRS